MKVYYDKHSTDRHLVAGQKALLLMPSSPYKMAAKWIPVTVVRAVDDYNYKVQLENRKQIFHCNMLKAYVENTTVGIVLSAETDSCDDEMPTTVETDHDDNKSFNIGGKLTPGERSKLVALLSEFDDVFTGRTGRTHRVEHNVVLKDSSADVVDHRIKYQTH